MRFKQPAQPRDPSRYEKLEQKTKDMAKANPPPPTSAVESALQQGFQQRFQNVEGTPQHQQSARNEESDENSGWADDSPKAKVSQATEEEVPSLLTTDQNL